MGSLISKRIFPGKWYLIAFFGFIFPTHSISTTLEFSTVEHSADTLAGEVILIIAYGRLGIDLKIAKFPAERALRVANHGASDGEVQRIDAISATYKNLIQVRPAINFLEATVFSRDIRFAPTGWASLTPFRIGIIRGIKFAEFNTRGMNRHQINTYRSLFNMIEKGRLDIAVTPRINGLHYIARTGRLEIRPLEPPVQRFLLFHYLHKKNQQLVGPLSSVLEQLQRAGEITRIRRQVNDIVLERAANGADLCPQGNSCAQLYHQQIERTNRSGIRMAP